MALNHTTLGLAATLTKEAPSTLTRKASRTTRNSSLVTDGTQELPKGHTFPKKDHPGIPLQGDMELT